jgi:hypothetical protein
VKQRGGTGQFAPTEQLSVVHVLPEEVSFDELVVPDELVDVLPPPPPIPWSVPGSTPMICTQPKARRTTDGGTIQRSFAITTSPAR